MRIQRQRKQLNRFEAKREHEAQIAHVQSGEGLFVFRNRTTGDLRLAKPAQAVRLAGKPWSNLKVVPPGGEWEGDNYFMQMVPQEAVLVRTIRSPQQEREAKMLQEQKLILDQPDKVTTEGTVEHVVATEQKKKVLTETPEVTQQQEVLLTEDPMDGVQILRG